MTILSQIRAWRADRRTDRVRAQMPDPLLYVAGEGQLVECPDEIEVPEYLSEALGGMVITLPDMGELLDPAASLLTTICQSAALDDLPAMVLYEILRHLPAELVEAM